MDEEKNKEKKTFMENAKGFMGSWKDDYDQKNKEILERKKKRDEEAEKEHQEFLKNLDAIKEDIRSKSEKLGTALTKEFDGFMDALKRGTATVHEKFQLQKHFDDFKGFIKKAGNAGVEKFNELTGKIEQNLATVDSTKLKAELPKSQTHEFDEIMEQAQRLMDNELAQKDSEMDNNQSDINKLFKDLDKE